MDSLVRTFGLPTDAERGKKIDASLDTLKGFYDRAAVDLNDACLGLHMAERHDRYSYGLAEDSLRGAPSVREALRRLSRYMTLANEAAQITLEDREEEARCHMRVPGRVAGLGRHNNEFFIATLLARTSELRGALCVPLRLWFAHPPPETQDEIFEYYRVFETTHISFSLNSSGFALDLSTLEAELPPLKPARLAIAAGPKPAQPPPATRDGWMAQLDEVIERAIAEATPTPAEVAGMMQLSAQKLQQRLADEGTSFHKELDRVREQLVQDYLDNMPPFEELAYLLGFTDMGAFRRALKRWTGESSRG